MSGKICCWMWSAAKSLVGWKVDVGVDVVGRDEVKWHRQARGPRGGCGDGASRHLPIPNPKSPQRNPHLREDALSPKTSTLQKPLVADAMALFPINSLFLKFLAISSNSISRGPFIGRTTIFYRTFFNRRSRPEDGTAHGSIEENAWLDSESREHIRPFLLRL